MATTTMGDPFLLVSKANARTHGIPVWEVARWAPNHPRGGGETIQPSPKTPAAVAQSGPAYPCSPDDITSTEQRRHKHT